MSYKLIVTDMDGTLLGSNHQVTDENKLALKKALEKGINVAVATGRMFDSAKSHTSFLGNKMPIISCNGALIQEAETGEVIYSNKMDSNVCLDIINILEKHNVFYQCCTSDTLMCKYNKEYLEKYKDIHDSMAKEINIVIKDDFTKDVLENDILKLIVSEENNGELLEKLKKDISKVADLEITSSWFNNIEIMNKDVNKGNAVSHIAKYLGIDKKDIIAFGDNYNDVSMLEYVGMGVAMGNADDFIKEKANYITSINDESGVAKALYNLAGI